MIRLKTLSILTLLLVCTNSCQDKKSYNLTLLSDQIPEGIPMVFGSDIISTEDAKEFSITFNPVMDEMYFTRRKPGKRNNIYTMKLIDGRWTNPELAFFSTNKTWEIEPHINPKGDKLYFGSSRPLKDSIKSSGLRQWYSTKNTSGWSEPIPLEKPFINRFVMYLTSSENDNLYITSREPGEKPEDGGIYNAIKKEGLYSGVEKMGWEINSGDWIAHSYIAPDESYMIFDGERPSGFGYCDLYISFKENGAWSKAHNLGAKINTELCEMTASVSPDGKYLFFHRENKKVSKEGSAIPAGNIYWVDFLKIKKELIEKVNRN